MDYDDVVSGPSASPLLRWVVPLSEETAPLIEGRGISGSFASETLGFAAMAAGKGMFGAIGAVAMISAGNELVEENNAEDPAGYIYESLAKQHSLCLLEGGSITANDA